MYISNLIIQGFKTFLPKTKLVFDNGITCIVGPNGCGKTNIVDAIRWILGEQKTSVLRSIKMNDIIFNGSKNRKPISFCEVSLVIHNDKGRLPVEYTDVEIKRRYYRSGESEYFINKAPCRLKDINDLFIDTGIGPDAYSVIELKMIENILSQNTLERRKLIEEAAGISQYRKQKTTTLNKLKSTHIDLERVKDVIAEINLNVKNLNLQMKRFKRHKTLMKKISDCDINISKIKISNFNKQLQPLLEKIEQYNAGKEGIYNVEKNNEKKLKISEQNYIALKKKYIESVESLDKCEIKYSNLNEKIIIWTEKIKSNELSISQFNDEYTQSASNHEILIKQIADIEDEIKLLNPKLISSEKIYKESKLNYDESNVKYKEKIEQLKTMRNEYEIHTDYIHQLFAKLDRANVYIEQKKKFVNEASSDLIEIYNQQSSLVNKRNVIKKKISINEKNNNLILSKIKKMEIKQNNLEKDILLIEKDILTYNTKLENYNQRLVFYEDLVSNYSGYSSTIQNILKNKHHFNGLFGTLGDIIDVDIKYIRSIEAILGDYSNYLVVKSKQDIYSIIDWMKKNDLTNQIGIISIDMLPNKKFKKIKIKDLVHAVDIIKCDDRVRKIIDFLLNDFLIIDKVIGINDFSNKQSFNLVDLEGNLISSNSFFKTSINKKNVVGIGKQNIIKNIKNEAKKLNRLIFKNNKSLRIKINDANKIKKNILQNEKILDVELKNLNELTLNLNKLNYYSEDQQSKKNELEKIINSTETEIKHLLEEKNDIDSKVKDLERKKIAYKDELNEIQNNIDGIYSKRTKEEKEYQRQQIRYIEIKKESENLEYRLKSNLKNREDLFNKVEDYQKNIVRMKDSNDALIKDLKVKKNNFEILNKKKQSLINEKNKIEIAYNKQYEIFQSIQKDMLAFQKDKESKLINYQELQIRVNEIQNSKQTILDRINELFLVNIDNNILIDEINLDDLEGKLDSYRNSIDRIGPVNMGVEDEYIYENDRLQHLKAQYDDIVLSEKNLQDTISKIDLEASSRLIKTFNEISVNFIDTYRMFFNGGNGKLRLIQGKDDPLDFDLEIIAQPPGKKTQTLRMLSAGEKALTAISLLFAIYLVKPSPFCILDEVDAPLDDNNVMKFSKAIREFSKKTQFIIVTHNKLTMEKADSLYGVTNQEEGISKVVSVKINNNRKMARA